MKSVNLRGIIPAIVLPMTPDYQPDFPALRKYVSWLVPQGPVALAVNVDTGEGPHLSFDERREVLETVVDEVAGSCLVVAGIAGPYTDAAVKNACMARDAGADALLVFPISAFLSQPLNPQIPYLYHQAIAEAADLPVILFQLQPALGGVLYEADTLNCLLQIEQVVAIKEASFDAVRFLQTRALLEAASRKITFLTGNDNFILESFLLGAEGALLGFSTVGTDQQVQMMKAVLARDYETAWEIGGRLQPLANLIFRRPVADYRARTKIALKLLGAIESTVVRPPLLPLGVAEEQEIKQALIQAGLYPME